MLNQKYSSNLYDDIDGFKWYNPMMDIFKFKIYSYLIELHLPGLKHGSVPKLRNKFGTFWRDIVLLLSVYYTIAMWLSITTFNNTCEIVVHSLRLCNSWKIVALSTVNCYSRQDCASAFYVHSETVQECS